MTCINDICEHIDQITPLNTPLVLRAISQFNPYLIINKITKTHQTIQCAQTISALAGKALSIQLQLAGYISRNNAIEDYLRNFDPLVTQDPVCQRANEIKLIVQKTYLL